jgi:hypothetical protein
MNEFKHPPLENGYIRITITKIRYHYDKLAKAYLIWDEDHKEHWIPKSLSVYHEGKFRKGEEVLAKVIDIIEWKYNQIYNE